MTAAITLRPGDAHAAQALRPAGGFSIVYADPAWDFSGNSKDKPGKNARRHYDCMKPADIAALPVRDMAADDALLLMWVTVPFAELAFKVVKAWGFAYKSQLTWPKQRIGTGHWARNRHEMLYICRRGKFPCERPALFPDSIIPGAQREHSRKPSWVHEIVEKRFPEVPKCELFGRASRPGWTVIGNQSDLFDGGKP